MNRTAKLLTAILAILLAVYFLQAATPLRLNPQTDSAALLMVAESAAAGSGFLYHGHPTVYAPGYPALIALLMKLHLARVWVLIVINVIFVGIGLLAVRHLLGSVFSPDSILTIAALSLLSFVLIKYTALVLTDMLFFGVSMCALAVMKDASTRFTVRGVALSVVLVLAAIGIRTIGVALVPAFLWMIVSTPEVRLRIRRISPVRMTLLIGTSVCIALALVARATSTLVSVFARLTAGHTIGEFAAVALSFRFTELGELAVNLPHAALPPKVQLLHLLFVPGIVLLTLILAGLAVCRKDLKVVDVFFGSYLAILLVWPYYDPRFWLPVLPLLIAYCALALRKIVSRYPVARYAVAAWLAIFIVFGLAAVASNTSISYSRSTFADLYPVEDYHSAYCAASYCREDRPSKIDPDVLHLLCTVR